MTDQPILNITKRFPFEAAHQLPHHDGKCARLHGHSYVLEVTVSGPVQPRAGRPTSGMVMDFSQLKQIVTPYILGDLDHWSLNSIMDNPTAENVVVYLADAIARDLESKYPATVKLRKVRLYETATSWVDIDL